MRNVLGVVTVAAMMFAMSGCGEGEKAWIVLEFKMKDGTKSEMVFDNPRDPNRTLAECKASLRGAQRNLLRAARQKVPRLRSARFVGARCVMSAGDPIKP